MESKFITRLSTVLIFFFAQSAIPILAIYLLIILLIYIINLLFKQVNPQLYFSENYLYILVTLILFVFLAYVSFIIIVLNAIKFGKTGLINILLKYPNLITLETQLYFYNIQGDYTKALEIGSKLSNLDKKSTTKIMLIDSLIQAKKFKKAEELLNSEITSRELDLALSRRALILLKRDKDFDAAINTILEAIDTNKNYLIRNAEPKLLELNLILAEIYLEAGLVNEVRNTLLPWENDILKHPFYSCCKYSSVIVAWFHLIISKSMLKQDVDRSLILDNLNKSIATFKNSVYAREAANILTLFN